MYKYNGDLYIVQCMLFFVTAIVSKLILLSLFIVNVNKSLDMYIMIQYEDHANAFICIHVHHNFFSSNI